MDGNSLERSRSTSFLPLRIHIPQNDVNNRYRLSVTSSPSHIKNSCNLSSAFRDCNDSNWSINSSNSIGLLSMPGKKSSNPTCSPLHSPSFSCRSMGAFSGSFYRHDFPTRSIERPISLQCQNTSLSRKSLDYLLPQNTNQYQGSEFKSANKISTSICHHPHCQLNNPGPPLTSKNAAICQCHACARRCEVNFIQAKAELAPRPRSCSLYQPAIRIEDEFLSSISTEFLNNQRILENIDKSKSRSYNNLFKYFRLGTFKDPFNSDAKKHATKRYMIKSFSRDADLSLVRGHLSLSSPTVDNLKWVKNKPVERKSYSLRKSLKKLKNLTRYYSRRSSKQDNFPIASEYLDLIDKNDSRQNSGIPCGCSSATTSAIGRSFIDAATCLLPPPEFDTNSSRYLFGYFTIIPYHYKVL